MAVDDARVRQAVRELLLAIGEDPDRPGLEQTPRRVAASYAEFFAGVGRDPADVLAEAGDVPRGEEFGGEADASQLVMLRGIAVRSVCEHHLLPFTGTVDLAYVPGARIVGLGDLDEVVAVAAARPQLQERLGGDIADALMAGLGARGALVVVGASHGCLTQRGSRQRQATTITVAGRGELADGSARDAALVLLGSPDATDRSATA